MCDFKWCWREGATLVRAILLPGWAAPGGRIIGPERLRQLGDIHRKRFRKWGQGDSASVAFNTVKHLIPLGFSHFSMAQGGMMW